jgi:hypothetical protein
MDFNLELQKLDQNKHSFQQSLNRKNGEKDLLSRQINDCKIKIEELGKLKVLTVKAVEFLHLVQKESRDTITKAFEDTVTFALRSIYQNDGYSFRLEFGKRGSLEELSFQLKSPTTEGYLDLKDATAGGQLDVISVALRFILLHLIQPPIIGSILLDENSKMLSSNFRINEHEFYCKMAERFNRQLIIVTHSQELAQLATNKLELGV